MSANLKQAEQTNKRYLVTLRYFVHTKDDDAAKKESISLAAKLNKEDDCLASIDEIVEAPYGKVPNRRIL